MNDMKELVQKLNLATLQYDKGTPIMSDEEWDDLYFELIAMEISEGVVLPDSPTQVISYQVVNQLDKVEHNHKMLSLAKTKELSEVVAFMHRKDTVAMCKMDGLTCSLRYVDGKLVSAETRGNGFIGEGIFHNALVIPSIPKRIKYIDELVVDGEVICTYDDFEFFANEYKNPRNFAAGSIRLLDSKECAERRLKFVAWDVLKGMDEIDTLNLRLNTLSALGFTTVPRIVLSREEVSKAEILENVTEDIKQLAVKYSYPIDGVVFKFDDVKYGLSQGETSHHFRNALAYKFYDEMFGTQLLRIEWTMGRTGVLTPIAVFEAIDIDGSTVERASLHNVTVMRETLGENAHVGQKVEVYKANMIIPQIGFAEKESHGETFELPTVCPICGGPVTERTDNDSTFLVCTNISCEGKLINKLDHFCGKKGLDIKGLSKMTLEKLINWGWVSNVADLYCLQDYTADWIKKPGFGVKSVEKVLDAIDASRNCTLNSFICALGIPLIGSSASKELSKCFSSWEDFRDAVSGGFKFYNIDGFGLEMHNAIVNFDYELADSIVAKYIKVQEVEQKEVTSTSLDGVTVVITGKLTQYKNRSALQADIESRGGKVVGSVSKNTNYLINNDNTSSSAKNVAAQKLGVPVLTEAEFIEKFLTN